MAMMTGIRDRDSAILEARERQKLLEAFPEGAIVYLKSGSPAMVCETPTRSDGIIAVAWFNTNHDLCRDGFHPDSLTKDVMTLPGMAFLPPSEPKP